MSSFNTFCMHALSFVYGAIAALILLCKLHRACPLDNCWLRFWFQRNLSQSCPRKCCGRASEPATTTAQQRLDEKGPTLTFPTKAAGKQPTVPYFNRTNAAVQTDSVPLEEKPSGPSHLASIYTGRGSKTPSTKDDGVRTKVARAMGISILQLNHMASEIAAGKVTSTDRSRRSLPKPSILEKVMIKGTPSCVTWLLDYGFDVYAAEGDLERALVLGIDHGDVDLISLSVHLGANIDAKIRDFGSPLQRAIVRSTLTGIEAVLQAGASIHTITSEAHIGGNCPLMAAISTRNVSLVTLLLRRGASISDARGRFGSALHTAAFLGDPDIVAAVCKGTPRSTHDEPDRKGYTPFGMAMRGFWAFGPGRRENYIRTMRLLLKNGTILQDSHRKLWLALLDREIRDTSSQHTNATSIFGDL